MNIDIKYGRNIHKNLSDQSLINIKQTLEKLEPNFNAKGGFTDPAVDDLYFDIDFEQARRHFLRDCD